MTSTRVDIESLVEDEWYIVRYSGEIPEVALHCALHHLSEDPRGPRIVLSSQQRARLLEGASQRYLEITLRDLLPENSNTSAYRGIKRSYVNWQRFLLFCQRHQLDGSVYQELVAEALMNLLSKELVLADAELRSRIFNCSFLELTAFMRLLEIDPAQFSHALRISCCSA